MRTYYNSKNIIVHSIEVSHIAHKSSLDRYKYISVTIEQSSSYLITESIHVGVFYESSSGPKARRPWAPARAPRQQSLSHKMLPDKSIVRLLC